MPILEFNQSREFELWADELASPARYVVVVTEGGEAVLQPTKTSRPVVYGYFKAVGSESVEKVVKVLVERGFKVFRVKSYTWDIERQPGTKAIEKEV